LFFHQVWIQGLQQVVDLVYNMALTLVDQSFSTREKTLASDMTDQRMVDIP
jgi:hypothetical protein